MAGGRPMKFKSPKEIEDKANEYFSKCDAEERLFNGGNTAGVIFNLKNNYGWVDKQEVEANVNSNVVVDIEDE